jgi:hypothetical protein
MRARILIAAALLLVTTGVGAHAATLDRHAGYYYPKPATSEIVESPAATANDADRAARLAFINGMTKTSLSYPYPPTFAIYAKGDQAEKMIITSLQANYADTLYRMRGVLAMLTAVARQTDFFKDHGVENTFTFFDLAKMMGFTTITVTDGKSYAHQVVIR